MSIYSSSAIVGNIDQTRPCHKCKYCSQSSAIMVKIHGICSRPTNAGKLKSINFAYDQRIQGSNNTFNNTCGPTGQFFVDRNATENSIEDNRHHNTGHKTSRIKKRETNRAGKYE
jgi:hypothetical protein